MLYPKSISILLFAFLITGISACHKDDIYIDSVLTGRWQLREVYTVNGGTLVRQTGVDTAKYVQFNTDGTLQGTMYPGIRGYHLVDSAQVSLLRADYDYTIYNYVVKGDTLTLANAACTDGCPAKFVKREQAE